MEVVFLLGVLAAVFVGVNIGGSSTGVAFGPSVGSRLVSKRGAAALMTVFALLGGWTVVVMLLRLWAVRLFLQASFH